MESTILRLVIIGAGVVAITIAAAMLALHGGRTPVLPGLALLAVLAGSLAIAVRADGKMRQLRVAEVGVFGGLAGFLALSAAAAIASAPPGREYLVAVFEISLVIIAYGVLVPNRWQRTAIVGGLLALVPVALYALVVLRKPELTGVIGSPLPAPVALLALSVAVAVIAAFLISAFRNLAVEQRLHNMYDLTEKIGSGGMGEVWLAEHKRLARPAAIKLIRKDRLGDAAHAERLIQRFVLEARATAQLRSPNTVEVYDFGTTSNGTFFYVMEYLDGLDLDTLIERHGPMPPSRAIHVLRQICQSIGDAHEQRVIHRDIKPANIALGRMGLSYDYVKVLDFGLAKVVDDEDKAAGPTIDDEVTGTPAFMAPETVTRDAPVGQGVDLYAIGCVAYWLITGRMVFEETTVAKMAVAHATYPPIPPSRRTDQPVPTELESIILRCLEKRPEDRFASVRQLDAALAACPVPAWTQAEAEAWWRDVPPPREPRRPELAPTELG